MFCHTSRLLGEVDVDARLTARSSADVNYVRLLLLRGLQRWWILRQMRNIMQLRFADGQPYVSRIYWYRLGRGHRRMRWSLELSIKNADIYCDLIYTAFEYLHIILKQALILYIFFLFEQSQNLWVLSPRAGVELGRRTKTRAISNFHIWDIPWQRIGLLAILSSRPDSRRPNCLTVRLGGIIQAILHGQSMVRVSLPHAEGCAPPL